MYRFHANERQIILSVNKNLQLIEKTRVDEAIASSHWQVSCLRREKWPNAFKAISKGKLIILKNI